MRNILVALSILFSMTCFEAKAASLGVELVSDLATVVQSVTETAVITRYNSEKKHLINLSIAHSLPPTTIPAVHAAEVHLYLDLDDLLEITQEGEDDWVTVWIDINFSATTGRRSPLPLGFSVFSIDRGNEVDDFLRQADFSNLSINSNLITISNLSLDGEGDDIITLDYSASTMPFSQSVLSTGWNLSKQEISRSYLLRLMSSALSKHETGTVPLFSFAQDLQKQIFNVNENGYLYGKAIPDLFIRGFTSSDTPDGVPQLPNNESLLRAWGGLDIDDDDRGDRIVPPSGVDFSPDTFYDLEVFFNSDTNLTKTYFIQVGDLPEGWMVQPLDAFREPSLENKSENLEIRADLLAKTLWRIGSSSDSSDTALIEFYLYDKQPTVDELLDTIHVEFSHPDVSPPQVVQNSPPTGGAAKPDSTISVKFSERVDPNTLTSEHLILSGSIGGPYQTATDVDELTSTLTLHPSENMRSGETVTVKLKETISDLAGNPLDGDSDGSPGPGFSWSFSVTEPGILDPPGNLTAIAEGTSTVQLEWIDNSTVEDSFLLERKVGDGLWDELELLAADSVNFLDEFLTPGTTYSYRLAAENNGIRSAFSNEASASPANETLSIDPPALFTAVAISSSTIRLHWHDTSDNENGFLVERRNPDGDWFSAATVSSDTESYDVESLQSGVTYDFRVNAYNIDSASPYTPTISATTETLKPAAPSQLSPYPTTSTLVEITWKDNSSNENGFEVERRQASEEWAWQGNSGKDVPTLSNSVSANSEYEYRVRAWNDNGYSEYSPVVPISSCIAVDSPRLSSPYSTENDLLTDVLLEWRTSDDVSSYDIYLDVVSPPLFLQASVPPDELNSKTSFLVTDLEEGTLYYWRVVAHAACNSELESESTVRAFATLGAPAEFNLIKPIHNAEDVQTLIVLDWENVSSTGTVLYDLYLGTANPPHFFENMNTRTEKLVEGLLPLTDYYWKVVAKSAENLSLTSQSPTRKFTTGTVVSSMVAIDVSQDAGLRAGSFGDTNYGGLEGGPAEQRYFAVGNDDNLFQSAGVEALRGALLFDLSLIPDQSNIINATLTLPFAGGTVSSTALALNFDPYTSSWTEWGITWNSKPALSISDRVVGSFPLSGYNPLQNDLTPIVGKWVSGVIPNFGIEVSIPEWENGTRKDKYFSQREQNGTQGSNLTIIFSNEVSETCATPATVMVPLPAHGSTGIAESVLLDWPDVPGVSNFELFFGDSFPLPSMGIEEVSERLLTNLSASTSYYWRVEAISDCNTSLRSSSSCQFAPCEAWVFQTRSCVTPSLPVLSSPAQFAVDIGRNVNLSWSASSGTSHYLVYLGSENPPEQIAVTSGTNFNVSVEPGQTYYWRVKAVSDCNSELVRESGVNVFQTTEGPLADAGENLQLNLGGTMLVGGVTPAISGTPPYTFTWRLIPQNGGIQLSDSQIAKPLLKANELGTYSATLTVTDSKGYSSLPSTVSISVTQGSDEVFVDGFE